MEILYYNELYHCIFYASRKNISSYRRLSPPHSISASPMIRSLVAPSIVPHDVGLRLRGG